jgi:hypothetical protein
VSRIGVQPTTHVPGLDKLCQMPSSVKRGLVMRLRFTCSELIRSLEYGGYHASHLNARLGAMKEMFTSSLLGVAVITSIRISH